MDHVNLLVLADPATPELAMLQTLPRTSITVGDTPEAFAQTAESADVAETHPEAADEHAEGGDCLGSENTTSAGINIFGRGDFLNRFNLFDNMSALPEHRVWFGFQTLDNFQTGFGNVSYPGLPLTQRRNEWFHEQDRGLGAR